MGKPHDGQNLCSLVALVSALRAGTHQRDQRGYHGDFGRRNRRGPAVATRRRALANRFGPGAKDRVAFEIVARPRIGELLVEAKVITQAQLDEALAPPRAKEAERSGSSSSSMGALQRDPADADAVASS